MGLVDWCVAFGSALASFVFLWWNKVDNYADPVFRITAWFSKLAFPFSPYLQLTISEKGAERFQKSEFFLAVEAYLSKECARRARKLKADIGGRGSTDLHVYIDDHDEVVDTYGDATVWWYASKKQPRSIISVFPSQEENRFYQVVFHRRHRDLVIDHYLPHVLNEGRAAAIKNRPRRLFTNKPSSRWKSYGANASWNHVAFKHPATFDTLAMDPDEKDDIVNDLMAFREAKDYYTKVGKAWKRGYLLYGPPGTGKSTMIAAMANLLNYDVYDLELTAVKNNTELRSLFTETKDKSIIIIEDIDCSVDLTGRRKDKKSKGEDDDHNPIDPAEKEDGATIKMTLSGVLNVIDGLWSACGDERIIIFTTNNKDKIDPALIRRGRMDKHIEMSYCRFKAFKVLARNYLDVEEHPLFGEIQCLLEAVNMSPADVAEKLMPLSKMNPDTCLEALVEALKEAKAEAMKAMYNNEEATAEANEVQVAEVTKRAQESVGEAAAKQEEWRAVMGSPSPSSPVQQADSNEWILDTSSLIHHTFNLQLLHDLQNHQDTGHDEISVLERGSVQTERFKVPDVHYIQGETRNVISVAQLAQSHGLATFFEPTCGYVKDLATGQEVGRAHLSKDGIYVLDYLLIQLNEGGGQAARKGGAGGAGDGGAGGRDGDDERKGRGQGGRGGGGTRGSGGGGAAGGKGPDGSSDGEGDDDSGSGGKGDGNEVEELQESSQSQSGMFGQPRSDRTPDVTVGVFSTSTNELGRKKTFYVDSGAGNHVTWNGDVLFHYPQHLSINTAIKSITGVSGSSLTVGGIGYIASAGGSLDHVLFVPDSAANLVSVSQLSRDYLVTVGFYIDKLWIDRIATGERIGQGYRVGRLYVLDRFDAECLVQRNRARLS